MARLVKYSITTMKLIAMFHWVISTCSIVFKPLHFLERFIPMMGCKVFSMRH